VDDYCPRERRITNHAVVALIDDQVKQTRCTTCDVDHVYKQARIPTQRRKRAAEGALDVNGAGRGRIVAADPDEPLQDELMDDDAVLDAGEQEPEAPDDAIAPLQASQEPAGEDAADEGDAEAEADTEERSEDEGPVHRRLIRAQLPRPEGHTPERKEPDFTMRQPQRRGRFEQQTNGNRPGRDQRRGRGQQNAGGPAGPPRFGAPRQGGGGQRPQGSRPGQGPRRKRGR
jgi:hypothetical protein